MLKRFIVLLLVIVMITPCGQVEAAEEYKYFPHENLLVNEKMEYEKIDPNKFRKFIALDEQYLLNTKLSREELNREIAYLDKLIFENEENYVVTKKGVILYTPNIVGNINVYMLANRNRKALRDKKKNEKFKYKRDIFYYPQKAIRGEYSRNINSARLLESYIQAKLVLENIDLDKRYLENLVFSVAPFKMVGINGFTEPFGNYNEGTTVVIGKEVSSLPASSQAFKNEIRSTVLHELGHVFHYVANRGYRVDGKKNLDTPFWKSYAKIYDNKLDLSYNPDNREGWDKDISENFAEDFRTYFSSRLGEYSFEPKAKRTVFEYRPKVEKFIDDYMKKGGKNEKPRIYKSFIKVNGEERPIDDHEILEYHKTDDLELYIEAGKIKKESFIQIWSDSMTTISKTDMKEKDIYSYRVRPNSNVGVIIKYEKIGYDYVPLWRINIVN